MKQTTAPWPSLTTLELRSAQNSLSQLWKMTRPQTPQLLPPEKGQLLPLPQHLGKNLLAPQTLKTRNHSPWPLQPTLAPVRSLLSMTKVRHAALYPLLLLQRLRPQFPPIPRPNLNTDLRGTRFHLKMQLPRPVLPQKTVLPKARPLVVTTQTRTLSRALRDRAWPQYSRLLPPLSKRIQPPFGGVSTSVPGRSHRSIPNLRATLVSCFNIVRIFLIDFTKPLYGRLSFGHFASILSNCVRLITNLYTRLSLTKLMTTSLSAMPLTIASVNMNNRTLAEAGLFLEQQEQQIDVLCIQEFSGRRQRDEIVLDHHSNSNDLSFFNNMYHMRATAVFITNGAGIIVRNSGITVLHSEIQPRLVTAKLSLTDPIRNGGVLTDQLVVTSVYAPAKPIERPAFFDRDLRRCIEGTATQEQSSVFMGDFNDFELLGLDRWPPYTSEQENERNSGRNAGKRCWATVLSPILQKHALHDAFRFLYPEAPEYSRLQFHEGEV